MENNLHKSKNKPMRRNKSHRNVYVMPERQLRNPQEGQSLEVIKLLCFPSETYEHVWRFSQGYYTPSYMCNGRLSNLK